MNSTQAPRVELIEGYRRQPGQARRWKTFLIVLLLGSLIAAIAVYSRAPVYRASASILTIKAETPGAYSALANAEHAAIQSRLLLGQQLLDLLAEQLQQQEYDTDAASLPGMLSVTPVPDTNLLELGAQGGDPKFLQLAVNQWARSYASFRLQQIETESGRVSAEIEDRQSQLQAKIDTAREQLREFRKANAIIGLERGENRPMAALQGLNQSLNRARQKLIEAEARQASIAAARERGKIMVPEQQKGKIASLTLAVQESRSRLSELQKQFTQTYIDRDPELRDLPKKLQSQERDLAETLAVAGSMLEEETTQEIDGARLSLLALQEKLALQQDRVEEFNELYAEFKIRNENLTGLQRLQAAQDEQRVQLGIRNQQKFPPIKIVEQARLPVSPIHPHYQRDIMIGLGIAFTLALFMTWLVEYLGGRSGSEKQPIGVNIYTGTHARELPVNAAQPQLAEAQTATLEAPTPALSAPRLPRELSTADVHSLLAGLDGQLQGYAALLLSGVSPYEIAMLSPATFDNDSRSILLGDSEPRRIPIDASTWQQIAATGLFTYEMKLPLTQIDYQLAQAAIEADLAAADGINALVLWHTYVMHLIRQGIEAPALRARVGAIPPQVIDELQQQAPGHPATSINYRYPAIPD